MSLDTTAAEGDCADCAGQNPTPEGMVARVALLPANERDDLSDVGRMEEALAVYESAVVEAQRLYGEWQTHFELWANRADAIYARTVVIQRSVGGALDVVPTDDYEEFQLVDIGIIAGGVVTTVTSVFALVESSKKFGEIVKTNKALKLKVGSGLLVAFSVVATVTGLVVAYRNIADRQRALTDALPRYHEWLYGRGDDDVLIDPTTATPRGAVGQIQEFRVAVDRILVRIRGLAETLGIETVDAAGAPRDDEVIHCEVARALEGSMKGAAEIEAAFAVAKRMLCLTSRGEQSFSVAQVAAATGLSDTVVQGISDLVDAPDSTFCDDVA